MTWRGITLGLLLALFMASATYFNDHVIRQSYLVGSHLPLGVFSIALLMVFVVNPLLPRGRLTRGEVAVAVALGLVACAWPGEGMMRKFAGAVAMPAHQVATNHSMAAQNLLSYVPGGSPRLADGYVRDWPGLARRLKTLAAERAAWLPADAETRLFRVSADGSDAEGSVQRIAMLNVLNEAITERRLFRIDSASVAGILAPPGELVEDAQRWAQRIDAERDADARHRAWLVSRLADAEERANRAVLEAVLAPHLAPPPAGEGLLLNGGRSDAHTPLLVAGHREAISLDAVPWEAYWPTVRLWCGAALALGLASLCVSVIVHPQWSRRELLPYPVVRFVHACTETAPGGGARLPTVLTRNGFWIAFGLVALLYLVNGLHAWFPQVPVIPFQLPFQPLTEVFPNAARIHESYGVFGPFLFPSVVGFAFFVSTQVSLTVGLATPVWLIFGSALLVYGYPAANSADQPQPGSMVRFGAFAGLALAIAYTGRRYYAGVALGALGLPRREDVPASAVWAARLALPLLAAATAMLALWAGMGWAVAAGFVAIYMLIMLVLARIHVETGLVYLGAGFVPTGVLLAFLGDTGLGLETIYALGVASLILVGGMRESLMPFVASALALGDREAAAPPGKLAPWLAGTTAAALAVALAVTLATQYNRGLDSNDDHAVRWSSLVPLWRLQGVASEASALGISGEMTNLSAADRIARAEPDAPGLAWAGIGLTLTLVLAAARLRFPGWPIHPALFALMGAYPAFVLWFPFLVGCLIKAAALRLAGRRGYDAVQPFMIGLIAGDLLGSLAWVAVGTIYFLITGTPGPQFNILPG